MENVKSTLKVVLEALVSDAGALRIAESHDDRGALLTISVGKSDMGRVIGKEGDTARAIRTLVRAIGMNHNERISVKINDPE